MKLFNFTIALLVALSGFGQDYTGSLDKIEQDGLYSILLTPEIRSAANDNLGSIRIKDSLSKSVPYVLIYDFTKTLSTFYSIPIFSKTILKDSVTSVIIENKTGETQHQVTLKIANTTIRKSYAIFGSNDQSKWFGLVDNASVSGLNSANETYVERTINFPLNNYQYIRIDFEDKHSLPINILEIGEYKNAYFTQKPIEIEAYKSEVTSLKDRKATQIKFTANSKNKIDILSFKINTEYYLREAKIIVKRERKVKKRTETYDEIIASFYLNSNNQNTFDVSNLNEKEFYIEIENEDNPPLTIEHVHFFQKPIYMAANLKLDKNYKLIIDPSLKMPNYDLGNFISDKTQTIDQVSVLNFSKKEKEEENSKEKLFWQTPAFMWICLLTGGAIIVYFTLGLLKDIKKNEK